MAALMDTTGIDRSAPIASPGVEAAGFLAEGDSAITTAGFLTVTSRVPGLPDRSEDRLVIDLLPAGARATGTAAPEQRLFPKPGQRFDRAMEGLRQIFISNGGLSRRLPATLDRQNSGAPDPSDFIWASGLEAQLIAYASEALIAARPGH